MTNPSLHFKFDDNANNHDIANVGSVAPSIYTIFTFNNDVYTSSISSPGRTGRSLSFCNSIIDISNIWKNDIAKQYYSFTVCTWFKIVPGRNPFNSIGGALVGTFTEKTLPSSPSEGNTGWTRNFYMGFVGQSTFRYYVYLSDVTYTGGTPVEDKYDFSYEVSNIDFGWHHYAIVRDSKSSSETYGSSFAFYFDGEEKTRKTTTSGETSAEKSCKNNVFKDPSESDYSQIKVGGMGHSYNATATQFANGLMDNFKLYNTNLSNAEILDMYIQERNEYKIMEIIS